MVVTLLGQQYNVGEKATVILYTYINRRVIILQRNQVKNRVWCWYFERSLGLQVIDVKDLKFTARQLMMYIFMKAGI